MDYGYSLFSAAPGRGCWCWGLSCAATTAQDLFLSGSKISVSVHYAFDAMIAYPTSEMLSFKTEIVIAIRAAPRERCRLAALWTGRSIVRTIAPRFPFLTKHDLRPPITRQQAEFRNVSGGWRLSSKRLRMKQRLRSYPQRRARLRSDRKSEL